MDWRDDETTDFEVQAASKGVNLNCSMHGMVCYYPAGQDLAYINIDAETHYLRKHGLDPGDVEVELCSSSWPHGGQHVGTLPTWVKVTHKPTGLQAESHDERSQLQNKAVAMAELERKVARHKSGQPESAKSPPPPPLEVAGNAITTIERSRSWRRWPWS